MNIQRFLISLGLMSVLLTACTPATAAPTPEGPSLPDDGLVLHWQRIGGIAGFCDDVKIFVDGSYIVENCHNNQTSNGQLDADQLKQVNDWANTFASFTDGTDETTPTYPDQMFVKIIFNGVGSMQVTSDDIAAISNLASILSMMPMSTPTPALGKPDMGIDPVQPEAAFKARDFLAVQLGIPSPDIKIISAEAVEWSDSCLGLGKPEEICAQVITPGYKVILEASGQRYEAHTDQTGDVVILAA